MAEEAEVKLRCAVYGEATVFSVNIALDADVEALQEAIFAKKRYSERYKFDASELMLYLARKKGGEEIMWLKDDDNVKDFLRGAISTEYKEMRPSWTLDDEEYFGANFQPERKEIHVLVLLPDEAKRPTGDEHVDTINAVIMIHEVEDGEKPTHELNYYQQCGAHIRNECEEYCKQVLAKIDAIYAKGEPPLQFICVEGSSGMGKSQLAFALRGTRPWFYWHATRVTEYAQALYKNFKSITGAFRTVVEKDDPVNEAEADILDSLSVIYQTTDLWTCGFIASLLEYSTSDDHQHAHMIRFEESIALHVKKCSVNDVRAKVKKIQENGKLLPFFILDEMTSNNNTPAGGKNMAAFQRNIFRACGLVVVVMGTDSKISNLVSQSSGSYHEQSHVWMSVVANFPPYQMVFGSDNQQQQEVWEAVVARFPVVEYIAKNSRGRFARYFVNQVVEVVKPTSNANTADQSLQDSRGSMTSTPLTGTEIRQALARVELWNLLDEAFAGVSKATQLGKLFMESKNGMFAQLMAISCTNVQEADEEPPSKRQKMLVGTEGMHLHFANLVDEEITDVKILCGKLSWTPTCCFPLIEKDLLLYLAILGGKAHSGYYQYNDARSVAHSTKSMFSKTGAYPVHENKNAISKEYKTYENMVSHALFCSSRRHGVQGIPFDDFLECLVGEFRDEIWEKVTLKNERGNVFHATDLLARYGGDIKNLSTRIVPFVAPPNAEWPQPILDTNEPGGCNFGHLCRAPNTERCDVYLKDLDNIQHSVLFVGECKYRADNVDMNVLKGIVDGLDKKWFWDVAMVFCLQLANIRAWTCRGVDCLKIDCRTGTFTWVKRNTKLAHKVIIVIETGRSGGVVAWWASAKGRWRDIDCGEENKTSLYRTRRVVQADERPQSL